MSNVEMISISMVPTKVGRIIMSYTPVENKEDGGPTHDVVARDILMKDGKRTFSPDYTFQIYGDEIKNIAEEFRNQSIGGDIPDDQV